MRVVCKYCGKEIALDLEGKLKFYCPRCKHFQVVDSAHGIIREVGSGASACNPIS